MSNNIKITTIKKGSSNITQYSIKLTELVNLVVYFDNYPIGKRLFRVDVPIIKGYINILLIIGNITVLKGHIEV